MTPAGIRPRKNMSEKTEWTSNARRWLAEFKLTNDYAYARSHDPARLEAAEKAAEEALAALIKIKGFSRLRREAARRGLKHLRRECFALALPRYYEPGYYEKEKATT